MTQWIQTEVTQRVDHPSGVPVRDEVGCHPVKNEGVDAHLVGGARIPGDVVYGQEARQQRDRDAW